MELWIELSLKGIPAIAQPGIAGRNVFLGFEGFSIFLKIDMRYITNAVVMDDDNSAC